MDDGDSSVDAVVDYCRTQARLLSGQAETLTEEIDSLLDDIDTEANAVRDRLDRQPEHADGPEQTDAPGGTTVDEDDVAALEAKQATVAEKQDRLDAIGDLTAGYTDLAADLADGDVDDTEAITRVLEFEGETEAYEFFDERTTLFETAADR